MALPVLDRLLTIVVTATITSAIWVVAGGTIMERARVASGGGVAMAAPGRTADRWTGAVPGSAAAAPMPPPRSRGIPGSGLLLPVAGIRAEQLTDTFTAARSNGRVHDAIDIMAPEGADVLAAAPGRVEKLFLSKLGGNTIYVRSGDGTMIYYYAHLRDYVPGLAEGQQVARGQLIGHVGHTGNASAEAPHLHFAIMQTTPAAGWWEPSTAINPYPLLRFGKPAGS